MNKLFAFVDLFRRGSALANREMWHDRQTTINGIAATLMAVVSIAKLYGYSFDGIDEPALLAIAGFLYAVAQWVFGVSASPNKGILPPATTHAEQSGEALQGQQGVPVAQPKPGSGVPPVARSQVEEATDRSFYSGGG